MLTHHQLQLVQGCYDDTHVIGARIGNVRDLVEEEPRESQDRSKTGSKTGSNLPEVKEEVEDDAESEDNGSAPSTGKKHGQPGNDGPWWNREEKVITEVRSHLKWVADTRELLEGGVRTLEAIEVPDSVQEQLCCSRHSEVGFRIMRLLCFCPTMTSAWSLVSDKFRVAQVHVRPLASVDIAHLDEESSG